MFIILNLVRRKERVALVLLGIIIVSLTAGLAAATARSTQGAMDEELARHWRTDYDLLVRHPDTVSELERKEQIVSGKFQSNTFPPHGITTAQLESIRAIEGVEVAAPLAIIGPTIHSIGVGIPLDYNDLPPGIYREEITVTDNNGLETITTHYTRYITIHPSFEEEFGDEDDYRAYSHRGGFAPRPYSFNAPHSFMNVVAVDFEAEAKLHGLDEAMVAGSLSGEPQRDGNNRVTLPLILNSDYQPRGEATVDLWRLTDFEPTRETVMSISQSDHDVIGASGAEHAKSFRLDMGGLTLPGYGERIGYTHFAPPGGLEYTEIDGEVSLVANDLGCTFGLLTMQQSIYGRYTIIGRNHLFRPMLPDSGEFRRGSRGTVFFDYQGSFDPEKLSVQSSDSPVAAPLEIYHMSDERVLKGMHGQEVPADTYAQSVHPYDFMGAPIAGLVPIESIEPLNIRIDSVRVRVSGVEDMSEASQVRIAYIAQQIKEATGLHVDIVLGSSSQERHVHLYGYDNEARRQYLEKVTSTMEDVVADIKQVTGLPTSFRFSTLDTHIQEWTDPESLYVFLPSTVSEQRREELMALIDDSAATAFAELGFSHYTYNSHNHYREIVIHVPEYQMDDKEPRDLYGVVEQYWIQLGTQMRIYQETNRGTFWITLSLLGVGALFIGNTTYISAVGRTGEFAALRSLGWRRFTVFRASLGETLFISLVAGMVTSGVLAAIWYFSDRYLEPWLLMIVAPAVVLTFFIGSIPPLIRTLFISPLQGVRRGELKATTRFGGARPSGFILRGLIARPGRTFVTSLALIIPGGTLAFMFFIYFGVQVLLGETLLGEYLAVELRGYHFLLNALIFAVAGLAVTDTLLINLRERQKEFGLLKAIGWRNSTVAGLLFWEGVGLGLFGGIIGTVIAGVVYTQVFDMLPPGLWVNGPLLAIIPALVAGLAAIVPTMRAAWIPTAQVIREE